LELNAGLPLWPCFVQLINKRFGPPLTESPIGELALLRRDGFADDFAKKFMALSYRDIAIMEAHQVQLFHTGLGKPLRTDVALQRPGMLDNAVMLTRAYKQRDTITAPAGRVQGRGVTRHTSLLALVMGPTPAAPTATTVAKPVPNIKRLSPAEIAQRRKDG
jgi:hypothetical protein